MKYAVTMPSLGADMDEGKLLEWHIQPGDVISKGQLIAAVETQKAAVDIESFRAGTVLELVGKIDDVIRVGSTIAWLEVADEDSATPAATPTVPIAPTPTTTPTTLTTTPPKVAASSSAPLPFTVGRAVQPVWEQESRYSKA